MERTHDTRVYITDNENVSLWEKDEASNAAPYIARYPSLSRSEPNIYCFKNITPCFCSALREELYKERGKGLSNGVRFVRKFIFRGGSQKSTNFSDSFGNLVISSLAITVEDCNLFLLKSNPVQSRLWTIWLIM